MTANIISKSHQIREIQTNYSKREGGAVSEGSCSSLPGRTEALRREVAAAGIHSHQIPSTPSAGGNSQEKALRENSTFWTVTKMGRETASPAQYPNARPLCREKNGEKEVRY